jgi:hypothetical protein
LFFDDLFELAVLVALFAAVSILTVASLTLVNALSVSIGQDSRSRLPIVELKDDLIGGLENYVHKLFPLYAAIAILLFAPILLKVSATELGIARYENGDLHFEHPILAQVGKHYTVICLGSVVGYLMYVVWHVSKLKRLAVIIRLG